MHDQQQQSREPVKEGRETIAAGIFICQAFSMPVRVWWTKFGTAGEMFFGGRACVLGWLAIPVWACIFPRYDSRPMFAFWGLTTLFLLIHRFRHWRLKANGYRPHSCFAGLSRLHRFGNNFARQVLEPLLTGIVGVLCLQWNQPLGMYLVWSGMAMVVSTSYGYAAQYSVLRRLRDARREQEWLAEKLQEEEQEV
ncbi:MAG TPA: hypothetical protein VK395_04160 [Gemmataceae bacterium]|nr:hypothetical protein [Gemmataceae bacterium]